MAVSKHTVMTMKSYQHQAENLLKNHLLADTAVPYTAIITGIVICRLVYDLTQLLSALYFNKCYSGLNRLQRIEWNNRGMSTVHAFFIAAMSLYFVYWSDLYADYQTTGAITFRNSTLSTFTLGVSVGYFIADLAMILWLYPSLGGIEYVVHHSLSGIAVAYAMFSGEGQLYTYMVLISEVTTPEINMRWFLDTVGLKRSHAYLINGIVIFLAWLVSIIYALVHHLIDNETLCKVSSQKECVQFRASSFVFGQSKVYSYNPISLLLCWRVILDDNSLKLSSIINYFGTNKVE